MTGEQGGPATVISIRTARRDWVWPFAPGAVWLALAALYLSMDAPASTTLLHLAVACVWIALGAVTRNSGVDLTPEYATLRGLRRRRVPWSRVQAVVQHRALGTWSVRLVLDNGKPLSLRAPTTWGGFGGPEYERDFHRIGQCWLAHRGESWRPLRPEAPALSVQ